MSGPEHDWLSVIEQRRRLVILAVVVVTLVAGGAAMGIDGGLSIAQFEVESEAAEDREYVQQHFVTEDRAITLVVVRGENVLSKESLASTMALQEAIRENDTVAPTLSGERPTADTGTVFVETYLRSIGSFGELTLADKRRTLETFSEDELATELPKTLEADDPVFGPGTSASTLLPTDYDGSDRTDARLVLVVHDDVDAEELLAAQLAIEELTDEHADLDAFVFGEALVEQRASAATGEAFSVLGPIAFVLVLGILLVAYRDPLDVLLALTGIGVVFVWTGGFVGWSGIETTQLLVAVPWLLLGLAVDYGLHVVMRYREIRSERDVPSTRAMVVGLGGVVIAIGVTTLTTAAGFLSGVFGPAAVRDFGLVTAVGIVSAFVVFGVFVPALKLELDERFDRDRTGKPVGRIRPVERFVSLGVTAATRAPIAVLVVALLVTAGGAYGAVNVDTSVDRTDFYPGEPPDWASSVSFLGTGEDAETLGEQATFLEERFELIGGEDQVSFLIRGSVTNESGVAAIHAVEREAVATGLVRSEADVYTPFTVIERFAAFDQRIVDEMERADTTQDGQPDGDVTGAFDATYEIGASAMETVVYRDESGAYRAVRVVVPVESGADAQHLASAMRDVADRANENPGVSVSVTGGPIVTADAQVALLETLVQSFVIALVVTFGLLIALFRLRYGSVLLGATTVVPVVFALSWVLGTMYVVGIPYNAETAIITGIAIGLGVDYAIHISTRFEQERRDDRGAGADRSTEPADALSRTVRDTGGTLFASAATTAVALGVLLFTFVPSLQRFGIVMVLVVVYAFVASVFLLPSLLLLQARWREQYG